MKIGHGLRTVRFLIGLTLGIFIGMSVVYWWPKTKIVEKTKEYPFLKYTIENLGKREYKSEIFIDEKISDGVYRFHFDSDGKRVNGLAHIPDTCNKCPVIVQFRGYQDIEKYKSGNGTRKSAEVFAKNGFISLAPDFLGYGGSASPSANIFEARLETYTTALNLLAAIEVWDKTAGIGVWGHSNGGQIALTVAEIKPYPTVVWAPVTAGFPYSIIYFMSDNSGGDKMLRKKLVDFENDYDTRLFDFNNYLDRIMAPVLILQGTADEQVPYLWNRKLKDKFKYIEYLGADHNLMPVWGQAIEDSVDFYGIIGSI